MDLTNMNNTINAHQDDLFRYQQNGLNTNTIGFFSTESASSAYEEGYVHIVK